VHTTRRTFCHIGESSQHTQQPILMAPNTAMMTGNAMNACCAIRRDMVMGSGLGRNSFQSLLSRRLMEFSTHTFDKHICVHDGRTHRECQFV
jgi:hypothetical protein